MFTGLFGYFKTHQVGVVKNEPSMEELCNLMYFWFFL